MNKGKDLVIAAVLAVVLIVIPLTGVDLPGLVRQINAGAITESIMGAAEGGSEESGEDAEAPVIENPDAAELIASTAVGEDDTSVEYVRSSWEDTVWLLEGKKVRTWMIEHSLDNRSEGEDDFEYICPYCGKIIEESKGIDRDHIIPVAEAHRNGGAEWDAETKSRYYYNVDNAVNVCASCNRSKSDKGPHDWMPKQNQAAYAYTWLCVAKDWNLTVNQEDLDVIQKAIADDPSWDGNKINLYDSDNRNYTHK